MTPECLAPSRILKKSLNKHNKWGKPIASTESALRFKEETTKDEILQAVKAIVKKQWPQTKRSLPNIVKLYFDYWDKLVWENRILLWGDRMVVPKLLQKEISKDLQTAHHGTGLMLWRVCESMYWPHMSNDIKEHIFQCEVCASFWPQQQRESVKNHEVPDCPWVKIDTDLFQYQKKDYLVTMDYYSYFFEID